MRVAVVDVTVVDVAVDVVAVVAGGGALVAEIPPRDGG